MAGRRPRAWRPGTTPIACRTSSGWRTAWPRRGTTPGAATGVEYRVGPAGGTAHVADAGEVILCGGSINSPQLLQLAGIGEAGHLRSLGIEVVADVPGVGANLQDHLEVYVQHRSRLPVSMQPHATEKWRRPWIGFQWLFFRSGPGATNHFEGGGFVRGDEDVAWPNLMFHFLPLAIRYDGTAPAGPPGYPGPVRAMYSGARRTAQIQTRGSHGP